MKKKKNHQESGFIEAIQSLLRIHLDSMRKKNSLTQNLAIDGSTLRTIACAVKSGSLFNAVSKFLQQKVIPCFLNI
jgi:hypothetical protein